MLVLRAAIAARNKEDSMAAEAQHGTELVHIVALLAAGVIAVPIFKRLGLGSVLG